LLDIMRHPSPGLFLDPLGWFRGQQEMNDTGTQASDYQPRTMCDCPTPEKHGKPGAQPSEQTQMMLAMEKAVAEMTLELGSKGGTDEAWTDYKQQWHRRLQNDPIGEIPLAAQQTWSEVGNRLQREEAAERARLKAEGKPLPYIACNNARCVLSCWPERAEQCPCGQEVYYCGTACRAVDRGRHKEACSVRWEIPEEFRPKPVSQSENKRKKKKKKTTTPK